MNASPASSAPSSSAPSLASGRPRAFGAASGTPAAADSPVAGGSMGASAQADDGQAPGAPPTLAVIGCGSAARVLVRRWHEAGAIRVGGIRNRSRASAEAAVAFLGAGRALEPNAWPAAADLWLLGTPDDAISAACAALAATGLLRPGDLVFHLSGALAARPALDAAAAAGARVGSLHPALSFADPEAAARALPGAACAIEGDAGARAPLTALAAALGARAVVLPAGAKTLYHAAAVFASNYVPVLAELAGAAAREAGLADADARAILAPLLRQSAENAAALDPAAALSGPVARGDAATVARHLAALEGWDPEAAALYRRLARVALALARRKGAAAPGALEAVAKVLEEGKEGSSLAL